ncbi:MAG: division/cell wall cluster transcriptional repressor MraZ [Cytophagaceae bacterium]|jgi:MraZ protein|nr:division/cell wall cluster transcriptional repressor MraZ [Cytophagaceae bacterium]
MSYFSGEYESKLDAKGRLILPSRLKANLPVASGNNIVITRGFETCLVLYSELEWKKIFSKVAGLNEFNEEYRNFQRNFFRGMTEAELDGNGRFLLPKSMLKYAQIESEAILVGLGNRIEIWNAELYDQFLIKDQKEFSRLAEKYLGDPKE